MAADDERAGEPFSDVNVGGPDGPVPGAPPALTVGTVMVPYVGDEERRELWERLDMVRHWYMRKYATLIEQLHG